MEELNLYIDGITIRKGKNPQTGDSITTISSYAYAYESGNVIYKEKVTVRYESEDVIKNFNVDEVKNAIISVKGIVKENPRTKIKKIVVSQIININADSIELQKYKDSMTKCTLVSKLFGKPERKFNEIMFNYSNCNITLDISDCEIDEITVEELLAKAEETYNNKESLLECISYEMLDDVWDKENKEISLDDFKNRVTLLYICVNTEKIYIELDDGDLFYGHRIHASFDFDLNLISANI